MLYLFNMLNFFPHILNSLYSFGIISIFDVLKSIYLSLHCLMFLIVIWYVIQLFWLQVGILINFESCIFINVISGKTDKTITCIMHAFVWLITTAVLLSPFG